MDVQGAPKSQMILKMKNKVGRLVLSNFKTYDKDTVIKLYGTWHKDRHRRM